MVAKSWLGALIVSVVVTMILLLSPLGTFFAEGAPGAPTATLTTALDPSKTQTVQVTIYTQMYSVQPPNPILLPPNTLFASVWQTSTTGSGTTNILSNARFSLAIFGSSGNLYTLGTTISIPLTAICSGSACIGQAFNLTISTYAQVTTYWKNWQSPTAVIIFSNIGAYQHVPAAGAADQLTFTFEWLGPILLAGAIDLLAFGLTFKNIPLVLTAVAGGVGFIIVAVLGYIGR